MELTTTAATMASVSGGTLWLVGEGSDCTEGDHCYTAHDDNAQHPPAEFVQACAPCETCHGNHGWYDGAFDPPQRPCPDCRIELVGPCPNAEGCPAGMAPLSCGRCYQIVQVGGTVTLGHAYAVGSPLPIVEMAGSAGMGERVAVMITRGVFGTASDSWHWRDDSDTGQTCITDRLAHYGPPESLVGKWALQLTLAVTT